MTEHVVIPEYVVGLAFCDEFKAYGPERPDPHVLMIRKETPEWQRGLLNGLGGKIEPGETPAEAMRREFNEEAGLDVEDWEQFATLGKEGVFHVRFYRTWLPFGVAFGLGNKKIDEGYVRWVPVARLYHTIPNMQFLVPLARYRHDYYAVPHFEEIR